MQSAKSVKKRKAGHSEESVHDFAGNDTGKGVGTFHAASVRECLRKLRNIGDKGREELPVLSYVKGKPDHVSLSLSVYNETQKNLCRQSNGH
ncbi:MAG: hypothetical protein [Microviridae sp.]|nr:MAG: hypothetical protein [Microviridae sp.]